MAQTKILMVDNDPDFLATRAEFLEQAGYHVTKATTLADAEKYLRDGWFQLAILDIRMINDDDEKDVSGMTLVNADFTRAIMKIVLTSFNTTLVTGLVRAAQDEQHRTIDVIEKAEGYDVFLAAVKDAIARHIHINGKLGMEWERRTCDPVSLVRLIEPQLESERLLEREEEFKDLFRRLFYEKDYINIERLLWQRDGRAALVVFAFKESAISESFVVVCGQHTIVTEEGRRFEEFAPRARNYTGMTLELTAKTTHFAANAYRVTGDALEKVRVLRELYSSSTGKVFTDTLDNLFQKTLHQWHQGKPIIKKDTSLETLYHQRLRLTEEYFSKADFEERIKVIMSQIAAIGSRIEQANEMLTFHFKNQSPSFPDPLLIFFQTSDQKEDVLAMYTPGILTGENILIDESQHAWLTDFADAGLAPLQWNFVSLEATIRFDWIDTNNLLRRFELENCLLNTKFARPDIKDLDPIVRRPAAAIQTIRKLTSQIEGSNVMTYHRGIYFQAASRLAEFDLKNHFRSNELVRLAHVLLSMAMIAGKFEKIRVNDEPSVSPQIKTVNERARTAIIGDKNIRFSPQVFEVFRYLYLHANEVCSKEELLNVALKGQHDEPNLRTLIRRIRGLIEDDANNPCYLITVPYVGYKLILKPES